MAEKRGVDEEPEAQVLPERELMQLVASDTEAEDVPVTAPQAEEPSDEAGPQSSPSQ